jgi:Ca2+-binding EF-hand superfamily protein
MEQFDSNGDGLVTHAEIEAARAAEFAGADSDQDANLSYSEFTALQAQRKAERLASEFAMLDQDSSDSISAEEFADGQPQERADKAALIFSLADSDSDGGLSLSELQALRETHSLHHYVHLDQNDDGIVSEAEFTSAAPPAGPRGR